MIKISFAEWLIGTLIKETIEFFGGRRLGTMEFPDVQAMSNHMLSNEKSWWKWLAGELKKKPNFWVPRVSVFNDQGQFEREWSRDEILNFVKQMASPQTAPQQQPQRQPQQRQQVQPAQKQDEGEWILAKAKQDEEILDHNGVPHMLRKGQYTVLKNNRDGTWTYATVWKGKLQWHNANISQMELATKFQSAKNEKGQTIKGRKASDLAKSTHKEEKKSFDLSDEQKDISQRFKEIKESDKPSHIVINALAGTGKTSTLKHLAETYKKKNEEWLYLVFGKVNRIEAVEKFPKDMSKHIMTTHQFAGKVLDANKIKPTDRFANYSRETKVGQIMDGEQYKQMAANLNIIPENNSMPRGVKWYITKIWKEFNAEIEKLAGLAKSYNVSPENALEGIQQISKEHDINSDLERTKEQLEKNNNADYLNEEISRYMGIQDFLSEDFLDRMIKAAKWVLEKSVPHGIDQEWTQTHEKVKNRGWVRLREPIKRNLRSLRDFDDDLWYAAQHADEIDWTKPHKYDYVLVDEVQDFNKAQKVILQKLIETGARVVAVGDPQQSLFRFRGADANAFHDITNMLINSSAKPEGTLKTLTKNFRSKPGLIDYVNQNTIVNNLQAGKSHDPDDPAYISDMEVNYEDTINRLGHEMKSLGEMKKETAFISRTNGPLAEAAMDLLKHKIPFVIYGKDLAGEIVDLIKRVAAWGNYKIKDGSSLTSFQYELDNFIAEKEEKWGTKVAKQGQLKDLIDAQKALNASIEVMQSETDNPNVGELKDWLYSRLKGSEPADMKPEDRAKFRKQLEEDNPVILTTSHRSKGLEFDRVFELTPSLYPHPKAKLPADLEQEENARYVTKTRARDEYHVVDDSKD